MIVKKRRLPEFKRQEWFRFKRLGEKWRKPRGRDSKMRLERSGKPPLVSIGYRSPRATRGVHPSGLREFLVNNPLDLEGVDANTHVARIASGVGGKKRELIMAKAKELNIKVLNPRVKKHETEHKEEASGSNP